MFFSINALDNDPRFSKNYFHNGFYVGLDEGWTHEFVDDRLVFYKGYADTAWFNDVIQEAIKDPTPRHDGNFCIIIVSEDNVVVTHSLGRPFPLYQDSQVVTNLPFSGVSQIFSDRYVSMGLDSVAVTHVYDYAPAPATSIKDILDEKASNLHYRDIKVFLSGGLNTMLCYALLKKHQTWATERITYEHLEYDEFLSWNYDAIKDNFWCYRQIHHWNAPTLLASGACGDEYFLRGPTTVAIWAAWHNIDVIDLCLKDPNGYQTSYYLNEKNRKIFEQHWKDRDSIRAAYASEKDLNRYILDILANDHQHWHLGKTLTWTPFKDLRIPALLLELPKEELLDQMLNATVERNLIAQFDPKLLDFVSKQKNKDTFRKVYYLGR